MSFTIVGGGLAGCTLGALLPGSIIYEREKVGGLCVDNENYQKFVHVLHTDYKDVWDFVNAFTTVRPHTTILKSYVNGELKQWPPKHFSETVSKEQMVGYNKKMWRRETPKEALRRVKLSPDGLIFHEKYQGVPDFARLFENLTKYSMVVNMDINCKSKIDLSKTILTGAIDEFFNYCYGKLPYRGMQSVHYKSEIGLDADFITFSDEKIPFQRLVDYGRLGYKDRWIGVEVACDDKHYPIRDDKSETLYERYKKLAENNGIKLCGRSATYRYMDMDDVIMEAMVLAKELNESSNSSE